MQKTEIQSTLKKIRMENKKTDQKWDKQKANGKMVETSQIHQ